MYFFDYLSVAREAGISDEELELVCRGVRGEFGHDEMMYELHVMRACNAVKDGRVTLAGLNKVFAAQRERRRE